MKCSEEHKAAVRQLYRQRKAAERKHQRALTEYAKLSYDGKKLLEVCSYCGAENAYRHKHRTGMCVECGKLYERWRKAKQHGLQSELVLLKPLLLQRRDAAVRKNKAAAQKSENFYKQVEQTEVQSMKVTITTHKVCKQCGRDLPIESFRKYAPRGTGVYNTTQGYNTICKDCESISRRAAGALRRGDAAMIAKLTEHYKVLQERGLEPVTAPAKKLLGVDTAKRTANRSNLDDILSSVQGTNESDLERHCRLVRQRGYSSFEEADAAHRRLADELRATNPALYGEISDLLDEWYMEE